MQITLASASPRRQALLKQICANFSVVPANIDEKRGKAESPEHLVKRLALEKAKAVFARHSTGIVLGSDTLIAKDNEVLGKPRDCADFLSMMKVLSESKHLVLTAVAGVAHGQEDCELVATEVTFAKVSTADAQAYWQTGEPQDKAGGYAIQGLAEQFISHISGSYSAVVGLPLYQTKQLLERFHSWT
ncbi:Maf family protein [Ningiella sp. W23]|uniref:Maf family protein n=1 Tax=Ningiella sp. W23 TaxID=3023715 RepID=UPI003757B130